MSEKNSDSSHSNNYDYYQLDYYDFEGTGSYYTGREDYLIKQQEDPEIINKRLISIPILLERQENILALIGPALVGIFVLISSVTAVVSMSAACASVAVAESLTNSTESISLVCQINMVAFNLKKIPNEKYFQPTDSFQPACLFGTSEYLKWWRWYWFTHKKLAEVRITKMKYWFTWNNTEKQ